MDWITTSTLLQRLHDADDSDAWGRLVGRFRAPLVSFARKLGLDAADAEDAAQEVLVAFLEAQRRGRYDRAQGRLRNWLFGIAYRQIASRRRARNRDAARGERGAPSDVLEELPDERSAEQTWERDWEKAMIESCLRVARGEVAEATYRAFVLVVREGRTPDEAAAELGMTRNAVYAAKHRVLKRLEELLQDYESPQPRP